jgi:glycosyltransferase involved in cell wall biosynthesis
MKVLVVNNAVPFVWGGAEELTANLVNQLNATRGVAAEALRIPFSWEPKERLVAEILLNQTFEIAHTDRVIALKFPAYLVQHRHKTLWLLHQFRQAYDLLEEGQSNLSTDNDGALIEAIRRADNACFEDARQIFCNSPVTQDRLLRHNTVKSDVLYPPLNDPDLFVPGPYGDYVFAGGRVAEGKRQHLLIEAMAHAGSGSRLVVAGPVESDAYAARLHRLVESHDLGDRVTLQLRLHSRQEIADLARNALACAYIPYQEDSLGYVTMEAMAASRCVVTTNDAGGLLEIVKDGETGWVCEPTAAAIGDAISGVFSDRANAEQSGKAAQALWTSKSISWATTIDRLLS